MSQIYQYRSFLAEMNRLARRLDCPDYTQLWKETKELVAIQARSRSKRTGGPYKECHALGWGRWEDLYTDPDGDWRDEEELLLLSVVNYKDEVPDRLWPEANYWTEVAFARGRTFTRAEGIAQQDEFIESKGGWVGFYGMPRNGNKRRRGAPKLRLILGGKA